MQQRDKVRINYYECNMTKVQHMAAYLVFVIAVAIVFFIYYRLLLISVLGGMLLAIPLEKNYAKSMIKKRQNKLRMQFNEFLEIIAISISGGSGRSLENAVKESLQELRMIFHEKSDIVREIELIISDYEHASIPMKDGFYELGVRSEIDDIISFATIYATMEGKTSNFGYVISRTHEIIKDKAEITAEIETVITSAKTEANLMLVIPLVIVVAMASMGGSLMDVLFTTAFGRAAATVGVICTLVSYVIISKVTEIDV